MKAHRFKAFMLMPQVRSKPVPRLHLMVRTGDFAKQSSGSAALETKGFARAGLG